MMSGGAKSWFANRNMNIVMRKSNNGLYIEKMKSVFGNNKAVSNYEYNKNKALHPYIVL